MFSKLGSIILYAFIDMRYAVFYMIFCLILWLVLQMPKYSEPSKLIQCKSSDDLYEHLGFEENELIIGLKAEEHFKKQKKTKQKANK